MCYNYPMLKNQSEYNVFKFSLAAILVSVMPFAAAQEASDIDRMTISAMIMSPVVERAFSAKYRVDMQTWLAFAARGIGFNEYANVYNVEHVGYNYAGVLLRRVEYETPALPTPGDKGLEFSFETDQMTLQNFHAFLRLSKQIGCKFLQEDNESTQLKYEKLDSDNITYIIRCKFDERGYVDTTP